MRVRVMTWNIHKGIGGVDRRYRPERIIAVVGHYRPDILLLQEVDEGAPRSRHHRQVDHLGDAIGLRHRAYAPNVRMRNGVYGNATLSRWPIVAHSNIDLTLPPKKRRGALYTRIRVRTARRSRTLVVYNLHLGLAGFERSIQIRRFLAAQPFAHLHPSTPLLVGGDFNDLWGTLGKRFLRPAGFARAGALVHTYPAFLPVRPLDGLHVRGEVVVENAFCGRMELAREASDHLPLLAELDLR